MVQAQVVSSPAPPGQKLSQGCKGLCPLCVTTASPSSQDTLQSPFCCPASKLPHC